MRKIRIIFIVIGFLWVETAIMQASGISGYSASPYPGFDVLYCQSRPQESPESKAQKALAAKSYEEAIAQAQEVIDQYETQALKMQVELTEFPWRSKEEIFSYWPLSSVALAYVIQGTSYWEIGDKEKAKE